MADFQGPRFAGGALFSGDDAIGIRITEFGARETIAELDAVQQAAQMQGGAFGRASAAGSGFGSALAGLGRQNRNLGREIGMTANTVGEFAFQVGTAVPSLRNLGMNLVMAGGSAVTLGGSFGPIGVILAGLSAAIPLVAGALVDQTTAADRAKEANDAFKAGLVDMAAAAQGGTEQVAALAGQLIGAGNAATTAAQQVRTAAAHIRDLVGEMRQAHEDQSLLTDVMTGTATTEQQTAALVSATAHLHEMEEQRTRIINNELRGRNLSVEERVTELRHINEELEGQHYLLRQLREGVEHGTGGYQAPAAGSVTTGHENDWTQVTLLDGSVRMMRTADYEFKQAEHMRNANRMAQEAARPHHGGGGAGAEARLVREFSQNLVQSMDFEVAAAMNYEGLSPAMQGAFDAYRRRRVEQMTRAAERVRAQEEREAHQAEAAVTRLIEQEERREDQRERTRARQMAANERTRSKAMEKFRDHAVRSTNDVITAWEQLNTVMQRTGATHVSVGALVEESLKNVGRTAVEQLGGIAKSAFEDSVGAFVDGEVSFKKAAEGMAKGIINALVKRSIVEAAAEGAAALASLASFNFPGAAAHGAAAAAWAGVAGVAASVGLATGAIGKGSKSGGTHDARGRDSTAARGAQASGPLTIVLNVNAPVDNAPAMGLWMAQRIREGRRVYGHGARLQD